MSFAHFQRNQTPAPPTLCSRVSAVRGEHLIGKGQWFAQTNIARKGNRFRKKNPMNMNSRPNRPLSSSVQGPNKFSPFVEALREPQAATHTNAKIAERAYEIWLKQGEPRARDVNNWLEAEMQLQPAQNGLVL
jgi:hypothetical protein